MTQPNEPVKKLSMSSAGRKRFTVKDRAVGKQARIVELKKVAKSSDGLKQRKIKDFFKPTEKNKSKHKSFFLFVLLACHKMGLINISKPLSTPL